MGRRINREPSSYRAMIRAGLQKRLYPATESQGIPRGFNSRERKS